jgi:transcriptional regulator with XRE-family HTH domain
LTHVHKTDIVVAMTNRLDGLLGLWTTTEIAAQMGASVTEVSRWRRGHRRPRAKRVQRLGDALAALRAAPGQPTNAEIAQARQEVAAAIADDAAYRRPQHR